MKALAVQGLSEYARRHGHAYGRIENIALEDGRVLKLDLNDEPIRDQVLRVDTPEHLKALYQASG